MKLYIKYMVSLRCIMMVKGELQKLEVKYLFVELGIIRMEEPISGKNYDLLKANLLLLGLELIDDKKSILVEKIKCVIVEMIYMSDGLPNINYSDYISEKLQYDYTYLANIFSNVERITIQQYIIIHKIERAKELIFYNELNLTEIAYLLEYSSVAHLSNQFKKITGLTPSFYKSIKQKNRLMLNYV